MMERILPPGLRRGDTIGIVSPCHIVKPGGETRGVSVLERLGFKVKLGRNLFADSWGFSASDAERADDINEMAADPEVRMVLFGGGEGAPAVLPLLDYETIRKNPKIYTSYSDGTTILEAIYAMTGLVTYYGQSTAVFSDMRYYNYLQFEENFINGEPRFFSSDSCWKSIRPGVGEGLLMGGYSRNFAMMFGCNTFSWDPCEDYILFIEDHEKFSRLDAYSAYMTTIWQNDFMKRVRGLIVGCYDGSGEPPEALASWLGLLGDRFGIPVVYTDDFGHGSRHAVLPIGVRARLDGGAASLEFLERTVGTARQ